MAIIRTLPSRAIIVLAAAAVLAPAARAIPHGNGLIMPDRVMKSETKVRVEYTLPCTANDAARIVMSNDDTGDRVVAVGVVVSFEERNCHSGPNRRFTDTVDPKSFGYSAADEFQPMPVDGRYDRELERYARTRLTGTGDRRSVEELIAADADQPMSLKAETLRCWGYPSWEGNGKAVGACLIEAESVRAGELRGMYLLQISDDTEHPGNQRRWTVHQVSYRI